MEIELNRVAIWQPVLVDGISVHSHPHGVAYLQKGKQEVQASRNTLYRYVKNYEREDVRYSLIVRTLESKMRVVEKELDNIAAKLEIVDILDALDAATMNNFNYTDYYLFEEEKANLPETQIPEAEVVEPDFYEEDIVEEVIPEEPIEHEPIDEEISEKEEEES